MAGRLAGRTAVVTAAGQGIGRAVALAFAREDASVVATDINEQSLALLKEAAPASLRVEKLDVLDPVDIASFAASCGAVDVERSLR